MVIDLPHGKRGEMQHHTSLSRIALAGALALSLALVSPASAAPVDSVTPPYDNYTGWVYQDGLQYWFDSGIMARSKEIYDPSSNAWYWLDADGTMAHDKDVYQSSNGGKWVRYDSAGHMIKGEDYRYGGWYFFDYTTGAMAKGMKYISSNGGKWVYYDWTNGQMAHGEKYVNYDSEHTGWYLFDDNTGAMFHGDTYIRSNGGKWVRYDRTSGKMVKGLHYQDGSYYYFDQTTGAMAHGKAWVPEWNDYAWFDNVTGRYTGQRGNGNQNSNSGSNSQSGVYYKNCDAVRAAGKAPLYRGQPGYRPELDRDNDGIACEVK